MTELLTQPLVRRWVDRPADYRAFEAAYFVGHGQAMFAHAARKLLRWEVKTRSGFEIVPDKGTGPANEAGPAGSNRGYPRVVAGEEPTILIKMGPLRLPEPSRVLDVFEASDRIGFTYGTKPGHPLTGEESFILDHRPDNRVFLVLRSASLPGVGIWRIGAPIVRLAQIVYRRRYSRALRG